MRLGPRIPSRREVAIVASAVVLLVAYAAYLAGSVMVLTDRGPVIDRTERPMTPPTVAPAVVYAEEADSDGQ